MNEMSFLSNEDNMAKHMLFAFAMHIAIFSLFMAYSKWGDSSSFISSKRVTLVNLKNSIRVDIVDMPKLTVKELKKIMPDEIQMNESEITIKSDDPADSIKADDIVFEEKAQRKKSLKALLAEMSRKKIPKSKSKKRKKGSGSGFKKRALTRLSGKDLKSLSFIGNKISKGTSAYGDSVGKALETEFTSYAETLPDFIRPFWRLPSYLKDQGLRCRIQIFLSSSGELIKTTIFEPSGSKEYDQMAMKALLQAVPAFPDIPEVIAHRVVAGEILVGFPL